MNHESLFILNKMLSGKLNEFIYQLIRAQTVCDIPRCRLIRCALRLETSRHKSQVSLVTVGTCLPKDTCQFKNIVDCFYPADPPS